MSFVMRYIRHRTLDRLRHSKRFKAFLREQSVRMSMPEEYIFLLLKRGYSSEQIKAMPEVSFTLGDFTGTSGSFTFTAGICDDISDARATFENGGTLEGIANQILQGGEVFVSDTDGSTTMTVAIAPSNQNVFEFYQGVGDAAFRAAFSYPNTFKLRIE